MTTTTAANPYAAHLEQIAARGGSEPAFLRAARRQAMDRFEALGFPTTEHEEWRYTNVEPIARASFQVAPARSPQPTEADLARFAFRGLRAPRVVFVDGRHCPALSRLESLPPRVQVFPLAQAKASDQAVLLEHHLGRYANVREEAFTALNTALFEDGVVVHVPRGVQMDLPIHVLYVTTAAGQNAAVHPRNLIVAEPGSQVTVIEDYVALADVTSLVNQVTEVFVGENAFVSHYYLEREGSRSFAISTLETHQERDSRLTSHSVLLGGAIVRNNVHPVLAGENCECLLNGLYVVGGRQLVDNHMRVEHAKPHGSSRQFYKGILDEHGRGVFSGRIIVHPQAQKTDAKQSNMNLLLSEDAQVESKPQLEIYADDVKCTHGATIGQIAEDALFYLQARGISAQDARQMLVYAFAAESLQRMKVEALREQFEALLAQRLSKA